MNIPQLPADKAGHLIAGLVVFCIFGLFSPIIGLGAAVVVGAAKEYWTAEATAMWSSWTSWLLLLVALLVSIALIFERLT